LVHLVGFIIKKFVTMQHGHVNVTAECLANTSDRYLKDFQGERDA
jgi:hypothetical protein